MIYTVSQGDCLSSIAFEHGLRRWQSIYFHEQNAAFRELRPDPNVIFPGDQVFVPEIESRIEPRVTEQRHPFKLIRPSVLLRVTLLDEGHRPLPNVDYDLTIGKTLIQGQADANGLVEQRIPAGARQGLLSVKVSRDGTETGYSWDLLLGAIDPPSKMTGIQARLNNLGYNTGAVDGIKGQRTTEAIRLFQEKYDLDATGDADQVTREKLVEVHGC